MYTHNLVTAMGHSRGGRGLCLPVTLTPEQVAGAFAPMMVDDRCFRRRAAPMMVEDRCSRRRAQNRVCLFCVCIEATAEASGHVRFRNYRQ